MNSGEDTGGGCLFKKQTATGKCVWVWTLGA